MMILRSFKSFSKNFQMTYLLSNQIKIQPQISPALKKQFDIAKKIKQCLTIRQINDVIDNNFNQIQQTSKTLILQLMNQFFMESHNIDRQFYRQIYSKIDKFENLNLYEKGIRLSILNKSAIYWHQNTEKYLKLRQKYEMELLQELKEKDPPFYILINLLFIFRVQNSNLLIQEIYSQIQSKISEIETWTMLHKTWNILIHQLTLIPLPVFSRYPKFMKILTQSQQFRVDTLMPSEQIARIFNYTGLLKLQKVGSMKIPKVINQAMDIFQKNFDNLNNRDLILIFEGLKHLPKNFRPNLQYKIRQKFFSMKDQMIKQSAFGNLFVYLNKQQINILFSSDKILIDTYWSFLMFLVKNIVPSRGLLSERINKVFVHKIEEYQNLNNSNLFRASRDMFKVIWICQYLLKNGYENLRPKMITVLKKFIVKDSQNINIMKHTREIDLLFCILEIINPQQNNHKQELVVSAINYIQQFIDKALKSSMYQKNYVLLISIARKHVDSKNIIICRLVQKIMQLILDIPNNIISFYRYKMPILMEILKQNKNSQFWKMKDQFIKQIPANEQRYLIQYLALQKQAMPSLVSSFLDEVIKNLTIQNTIFIISTLNPHQLTNSRGYLHKKLYNALKETEGSVELTKKNINQINRFLSVILNFNIQEQVSKLYIGIGIQMADRILDEDIQFTKNNRLILSFMGKIQSIYSKSPNSRQKYQLLQKFNLIYKKFDKKQNGPYFQARYIQFIASYLKEIPANRGLQIQKLHTLTKHLSQNYQLHNIPQILMILLKNYCLGLIELQKDQVTQYFIVLETSIKNHYITAQIIQEYIPINSILNNLKQNKQKLRQFLLPLFIEVLKTEMGKKNFYIYKDYLRFFRDMEDYDSTYYLTNNLLQQFLYPYQISYLISSIPNKVYDRSLLNSFIHKFEANKKNIKLDVYYFLYFLETFYAQIPSQAQQIVKIMYEYLDESLNSIIHNYKKMKNFSMNKSVALRILKGLYCLIKSGKFEANKDKYSALLEILSKHQQNMRPLFNKNQGLVNQINMIYYYLSINSKQVPKQARYTSYQFQQYLKNNSIKYNKNQKINNINIVYYLPETDQAVIIAQKRNINHIGEYQYHGYIIFHKRLIQISTGLKTKIFNTKTNSIS